jgi:hypothetical protein
MLEPSAALTDTNFVFFFVLIKKEKEKIIKRLWRRFYLQGRRNQESLIALYAELFWRILVNLHLVFLIEVEDVLVCSVFGLNKLYLERK